jgi:hypothetical protein
MGILRIKKKLKLRYNKSRMKRRINRYANGDNFRYRNRIVPFPTFIKELLDYLK